MAVPKGARREWRLWRSCRAGCLLYSRLTVYRYCHKSSRDWILQKFLREILYDTVMHLAEATPPYQNHGGGVLADSGRPVVSVHREVRPLACTRTPIMLHSSSMRLPLAPKIVHCSFNLLDLLCCKCTGMLLVLRTRVAGRARLCRSTSCCSSCLIFFTCFKTPSCRAAPCFRVLQLSGSCKLASEELQPC